MSLDLTSIGKILAALGVALTAAGISLPLSSQYKEVVIALGAFFAAVGAYIANRQIKKL